MYLKKCGFSSQVEPRNSWTIAYDSYIEAIIKGTADHMKLIS
jgi:hypothetical protein